MKAVVLASGYATRLWPIIRHRLGMFSPVSDQMAIDTIFEDLEADGRVSEVFVSTNERFADAFEEYIDESPFDKPTLSIEDTSEGDEKSGVVDTFTQLVNHEEVDRDLAVIAGDSLISFDVGDFVGFFYEKNEPCLAAYDVGDKKRAKAYGLVELDGDRVINFQKKSENPKSTLVSITCHAIPVDDLPKFDEYLSGDNNPDEPDWFIQWLQRTSDLFTYAFDEAWFDIGAPQSYLDTVGWYLDGENFIHESATLTNTEVGTNVHVMVDAVAKDSVLEESTVSPGTVVRNTKLRNSIVDEETHIGDLDLSSALIGAHSRLTNGQ